MNKERSDERRAKGIIERELGITIEHADKNGGVDYRSRDGAVAVEVTRVTDEAVVKGRLAWGESEETPISGQQLQSCWLVHTSETTAGLKTFRQRVHPYIVQLEAVGLDRFSDQRDAIRVIDGGEHADLFRELLTMGVENALALPHAGSPDPDHVHRVHVTIGGGAFASGSDEAVSLLCDALVLKTDNAAKLDASDAKQRHLFVWIDRATAFGIERALSNGVQARDRDDDSGHRLPTQAPSLDPAITHLWVAHEGTGRGWLWADQTWRAFEDVGSEDKAGDA